MARRIRKTKPGVLQLRITLRAVEGPVWRRLLVTADVRLDELHLALNEAMGWTNSHLHRFLFDETAYADPTIDEGGDFEDERAVSLDELAGVGDRFAYEYDFGDDWAHDVVVEKKLPFNPSIIYPVCIGGARACPPEDCHGPHGYAQLLEALANGDDDHELVQGVGGFFEPEGFDVNRTNRALRHKPE